ncbi:GNAT family N-acetyltransferase [Motilibacter aurantiacus]|uniref:GNAT family N-acetyltransferase n=1 Tax=Motilibacter aurantiacus TaxID=2714955 RepID=UPI00140DAC83|nr:GNAT family N-acetyltransferase [Motilibacter aurantiacus]NHC45503.1 GNAT family N-acetyltransferase [Motilibacter aurantiacus]
MGQTVTDLPAGRRHVDAAVAVLAAALRDDPGWAAAVPDPPERAAVLAAVLRAAVADAVRHGRVLVARGPGGDVLGAAVWLPPGAYPMTGGRSAAAALRLLRAAARRPGAMRAAASFGAAVDRAFPDRREDPVAYLQALGVSPAHARRGVGRALLAPLLAAPFATYLETAEPVNVGYYERVGFCVLPGSPGAIGGSGPAMWRMRRPAPGAPPAR